jgi:DNA-binding Lrp family transcriptional regulator
MRLGEAMGLSLPAASRTVDALVQLGYAERREDDVDRRMKRVAISAARLEALARVRALRVEVIARFLERLGKRDRRRLAAAAFAVAGALVGWLLIAPKRRSAEVPVAEQAAAAAPAGVEPRGEPVSA